MNTNNKILLAAIGLLTLTACGGEAPSNPNNPNNPNGNNANNVGGNNQLPLPESMDSLAEMASISMQMDMSKFERYTPDPSSPHPMAHAANKTWICGLGHRRFSDWHPTDTQLSENYVVTELEQSNGHRLSTELLVEPETGQIYVSIGGRIMKAPESRILRVQQESPFVDFQINFPQTDGVPLDTPPENLAQWADLLIQTGERVFDSFHLDCVGTTPQAP